MMICCSFCSFDMDLSLDLVEVKISSQPASATRAPCSKTAGAAGELDGQDPVAGGARRRAPPVVHGDREGASGGARGHGGNAVLTMDVVRTRQEDHMARVADLLSLPWPREAASGERKSQSEHPPFSLCPLFF
jgi:hypothetical protein